MRNIADDNWFFKEMSNIMDSSQKYEDVTEFIRYEKKISNGYVIHHYNSKYVTCFKDEDIYESKHFRQMSMEEKNFLYYKVDQLAKVGFYDILDHANDSFDKRKIYRTTINDILIVPQLLECRIMMSEYGKITDARITLRSTTSSSKRWVYYGVFSIITNRLITVYPKQRKDIEVILQVDNKKYNSDLDLIKIINSIK